MTHSLITPTVAAVAVAPITPPNEKISAFHRHVLARRDVLLGGAVVGLSIINDRSAADAAARRPPPPPPTEKKDPNVSGVLAKVLASKKRKEAMKEAIAQLREKGKPIISEPTK
ncbi:hypothetical protein Tco_0305165 [Tanacetum coccineum]